MAIRPRTKASVSRRVIAAVPASQCSSAVEQRFRKPSVAGSIPAIGSSLSSRTYERTPLRARERRRSSATQTQQSSRFTLIDGNQRRTSRDCATESGPRNSHLDGAPTFLSAPSPSFPPSPEADKNVGAPACETVGPGNRCETHPFGARGLKRLSRRLIHGTALVMRQPTDDANKRLDHPGRDAGQPSGRPGPHAR
jgi:hypothetical protein